MILTGAPPHEEVSWTLQTVAVRCSKAVEVLAILQLPIFLEAVSLPKQCLPEPAVLSNRQARATSDSLIVPFASFAHLQASETTHRKAHISTKHDMNAYNTNA